MALKTTIERTVYRQPRGIKRNTRARLKLRLQQRQIGSTSVKEEVNEERNIWEVAGKKKKDKKKD